MDNTSISFNKSVSYEDYKNAPLSDEEFKGALLSILDEGVKDRFRFNIRRRLLSVLQTLIEQAKQNIVLDLPGLLESDYYLNESIINKLVEKNINIKIIVQNEGVKDIISKSVLNSKSNIEISKENSTDISIFDNTNKLTFENSSVGANDSKFALALAF